MRIPALLHYLPRKFPNMLLLPFILVCIFVFHVCEVHSQFIGSYLLVNYYAPTDNLCANQIGSQILADSQCFLITGQTGSSFMVCNIQTCSFFVFYFIFYFILLTHHILQQVLINNKINFPLPSPVF